MATNLNKVLKHIHHLLAPPGGVLTDGELLARFNATRDDASFAALVRRHGPMVLSVCRRMLRHDQDAEDCFQATFMVLARKAATVKRESVGSWLYAVAYRTSLEARAISARRRAREKQVQDMPHPEVMPPDAQDWRHWLDQELNRLPETYRAVIVACDLEGRSRKEASRHLGIGEGTLSSRLARGRRLLAKRLAPYGLSLSGATLAAALYEGVASAQVPATLFSATTKAAVLVAAGELAAVSVSSAILMKGVLKSMFLTKLKLMIGAVMIVTALGASSLVYRAEGQSATPAEKSSDGKPRSELERLRHENELLKLNLEVVLEKVRAQEAELRTLKGRPTHAAVSPDGKIIATTRVDNVLADVVTNTVVPVGQLKVDVRPIEAKVLEVRPADVARIQGKVVEVKPVVVEHIYSTPSGARTTTTTIEKPRNKEDLNRTIDALEKALKELREQLRKENEPKKQGALNEKRDHQAMGMQRLMQQQMQKPLVTQEQILLKSQEGDQELILRLFGEQQGNQKDREELLQKLREQLNNQKDREELLQKLREMLKQQDSSKQHP